MHAHRFVCRIVLMAVWTVGIGYAGDLFGAEGAVRRKATKRLLRCSPRVGDASAAGLPDRSARHFENRGVEAGSPAAVQSQHLRRAANPCRGHVAGSAHRRLLSGGRRRGRHSGACLREGPCGRHDHCKRPRPPSRRNSKRLFSKPEVSVQLARTAGIAAGHRSILGRTGRHRESPPLRHGSGHGQDGRRSQGRRGEATLEIPCLARGVRRGRCL